MRRLKFALLFVLVICLVASALVACNPTSNNANNVPNIPVDPGNTDTTAPETLSGLDAYALFKQAALNTATGQKGYINADTLLYLDYIRDKNGYSFAVKLQLALDLVNDANSQMLVELWRMDANGVLTEMLIGFYYYDSTIVYDCSGAKKGAKAVKTDDIDITAIAATLQSAFGDSEFADLILNKILGIDIGELIGKLANINLQLGTLEGILTAFFGDSRLFTFADGSQRLEMPLAVPTLIWSLLSGLFTPGGLIPEDIVTLVNDVLGINLDMLAALVPENVSIYLVADIKSDKLFSTNLDLGIDFNTADTSLEDKYGIIQSELDLSLGSKYINSDGTPIINVEEYLTEAKAPEGSPEIDGGRGLDLASLEEYSLLTLDLSIGLDVLLAKGDHTVDSIVGAFGTLISGLIPGYDGLPEGLKQKTISFDDMTQGLYLNVKGGINMRDPAQTNLLVEITGKNGEVRASVAYVGADEALYVDLTGILGAGKVKVSNLNLNAVLGDLINQLIETIKNGIGGLTAAQQQQVENYIAAAENEIANGGIVQGITANGDGEPIQDTVGLIVAIINNINVNKDGDIFNITGVTVTLTQTILDYIFGLVFTGDFEGANIPLVPPTGKDNIELEYVNEGFGKLKTIKLGAGLGIEPNEAVLELGLRIDAQFGSVRNPEYFNSRIAEFKEGNAKGEFITLATFDDLKALIAGDGTFDVSKLLAGIDTVGLGLEIGVNISAQPGKLADIKYDNGNDLAITVLAAFEEAFGANATLVLKAELGGLDKLVSGGLDIGALLGSSNIYAGLRISDGSTPLEIWLMQGVLYVKADEQILGGLNVKMDLSDILASLGNGGGTTAADASAADESGATDGGSSIDVMGLLVAVLGGVKLGDTYIDVYFSAQLISALLGLINVQGLEITGADGGPLSIDEGSGISIALNDGLDLTELAVKLNLGIGDSFDFGVDIGGLNLGINSGLITAPVESEFSDFFETPYAYLSLGLGVAGHIDAGEVSLGEGFGEIIFDKQLDFDYGLGVQGKIDIAPILAQFMGKTLPEGYVNGTQLAVTLTNGEKTLIGIYYNNGKLYVDANVLGVAPVSIDVDIVSLILDLIGGTQGGGEGSGASEAATADDATVLNAKNALFLALKVSSKGFIIEVTEGLTEMLVNLIGINIPEISAILSVDWTQIGKTETDGKLLSVNVGIGDEMSVEVYIDAIGLALGEDAQAQEFLPDLEGYTSIGSIEKNDGGMAVTITENIFLSVEGSIDLKALADTEDSWTVGQWIEAFLKDANISQDPAVNAGVKNLLSQIVLKFGIDRDVATTIDFRLSANMRFNPANLADVNYLLSHSDIALEVFTTNTEGVRSAILSVYLLAGENGTSTLYVGSDEGGIIDGVKLAIPNLDLNALLAGLGGGTEEGGNEAVTTADGTEEPAADNGGVLDIIKNIIGNAIYGIYVDDTSAKINLGAQFLTFILNTFLTDEAGNPVYNIDPDNFVQLNPENSFLALYFGGEDESFGIEVSLGIDPFTVALSLGGLRVAFGEGNVVTPDGFRPEDYQSIYDNLEVLSVETDIDLEVALKNTTAFENGELAIGDLLSAIIANLELSLGLEIPADLVIGVNLYVGANINRKDASATEIVLELTDKNSADGEQILGVYLRGSQIWVKGVLFENSFTFENTAFAQIITEKLAEFLAGVSAGGEAGSAAEAVSAADNDGTQESLDVLFNLSENHISLIITQELLKALIEAVAGDQADEITHIIEQLNPEANLDVDFSKPSISLKADIGFASLGLAINSPKLALDASTNVTDRIDAIKGEEFNSYAGSSVVRFDLDVSVSYSASATYIELSQEEAARYPSSERYIPVGDGSYVQNPKGLYVRKPMDLSDIIDVILKMPAIEEALGGLNAGDLQGLIDALVASLGLDLALDDPIDDNFQVKIFGALDLKALGIDEIFGGNFATPEIDLRNVLENALQVGIQIIFNPETSAAADVAVYLAEGDLYLDLDTLGGPRIKFDLIDLLDRVGAFDTTPATGGDATTADETSDQPAEEGVDIGTITGIIDALIDKLVLTAGNMTGGGNILENGLGIAVLFNSNMLSALLGLITGTEVDLDGFELAEGSELYLDLKDGGIALGVRAKANTGFELKLETETGIQIDVATSDKEVVPAADKEGYVDVTQYIYSICAIAGAEGFEDYDISQFTGQRITFSLGGILYFNSTASESYNLGSLLSSWIEDLVLELKTDSAFNDGVGFRLSVSADLAKLNISALLGSKPDFDAFLAESDLDSIEFALELIELDEQGNVKYDENGDEIVVGGIYLYRGTLYLDGKDVFDIVDNYSYVPNFLDFVLEAAKLGQSTGNQGAGSAVAATSADTNGEPEVEEGRNAMLSLIYSNTLAQIVITKTIVSLVLATLVPDLGDIAEIFDTLQISLDLDLGRNNYIKLTEEDKADTEKYPLGHRYTYYGTETFVDAAEYGVEGDYIKLTDTETEQGFYLRADNYVLYTYNAESGNYEIATSVEADKTYFVKYLNRYRQIENTRYVRLYGYVQDNKGTLYRVYDPNTNIKEFYIGLNLNVGAIDLGLKLGGLNLEFGDNQLIPQYILDGKDKNDPEKDVPLLPFYDSVITVGMSVEFELGITEGAINIGEMLKPILGDIGNVRIEMPETSKGYSSAHMRLDLSVMLDMFDIANSEISISLVNLSSEAGAEVEWIAAYYMCDMLYLDLSFFNLPKVAVPLTAISEYLDQLLGDILDGSIYDDVEIPSASEAVAAEDAPASEVSDLTVEEKVAQLLISNRMLSLSVGNAVMRYLLQIIKLGDNTLEDLIYDDLLGSLEVKFDMRDGVSVDIGAYLALQGDRYFEAPDQSVGAIESGIAAGSKYYVFKQAADGSFTMDGEEFREMGTSDKLSGENIAFARYDVKVVSDGADGKKLVYVNGETKTDLASGDIIYAYRKGPDANTVPYDMEMNLNLSVNNINVYFKSQHEYSLTSDEIKEYKNFNNVDTVKLSETISLDLLFDHDSEIDLTPLLEYLFPDISQELKAVINSESNAGGDVLRNIDLVIALEFKLGEFMNRMRELGANVPNLVIPDEFDLVSFIQVLVAIIQSDALGLEMMLDYINASVEIVTYDPEDNAAHNILGVYLISGKEGEENNGLFVDLSYFGQPGIQIKLSELQNLIDDLMGQVEGGSAASEAVTADGENGLPSIDTGLNLELPLISAEIAGYISAFLYGMRITSSYIQVLANADLINQLLLLLTGEEIDLGTQNNMSYITINTDFNNYRFVAAGEATPEQLNYTNSRFRVEANENGLYWLDRASGEYRLRTEMTETQKTEYEQQYGKDYYDILPIELYLDVNGEYVSVATATRTDWIRAARNDNGTYVFFEKQVAEETGEVTYINLTENTAGVYAIYVTEDKKPVIEANIWLWEYKIGLGIQLPDTAGEEYIYSEVGENNGDYVKVADELTYSPDGTYSATEARYLYYRGHYYEITKDNLYKYENGKYSLVNSEAMTDFTNGGAYDKVYFVLADVVDEGFKMYVQIKKDLVYRGDVVRTKYEYVGEGKGNYTRSNAESLISRPDYFVNYNNTIDYAGTADKLYLDTANGEFVSEAEYIERYGSIEGAAEYNKGDVSFVRDGDKFVSVNTYTSGGGSLEGKDVYGSEHIKYVDTDQLYAISLTLRGSIFLGKYSLYMTEAEWRANETKYGAFDQRKDTNAYALVDGHYVQQAGGKYYRYTADTAAIKDVLGAIFGDLEAQINVADDYSAEILFEIKVNVTIDYSDDDTVTSLYVKKMNLAVDAWRREQTDGSLTHILGLYYMNDLDSDAALYADLTWLLGSGAKFKVDLSAYSIEDLLADKLDIGSILGGLGGGAAEAVAAGDAESSASVNVGNPNGAYALLNFYTRSLALKASAGFLKLIVNMIAPNAGATIEEMLPNIVLNAQIDLAPYNLTIGATLFDESGDVGLLDLGITLNLFNNEDKTKGMQIDFGSEEEFKELDEQRLASGSKDYIFYYGMFTKVEDGEGDYVKDGTEKGYVKQEGGNYVKNTATEYKMLKQSSLNGDGAYAQSERYALVPDGYKVLNTAEEVNEYYNGGGSSLYYFQYYYATGRTEMKPYVRGEYSANALAYKWDEEKQTVVPSDGFAKLYIEDNSAKSTYVKDANGVHKAYTVFSDYQQLLSLDLGALLAGEQLDILDMLANSGIETLELSFSLNIDLSFGDIINWTEQMSRLMTLKDGSNDYLKFILASLARNQAEFMSYIGGTLNVALQVNAGALLKALPELTSGGGITIDGILPLLAGTKAYIEFFYRTNYHGDDEITIADEPLRIWLELDKDVNANVYIQGNNLLGQFIQIGDSVMGDFLGQKLKLEGLPLESLLASLGSKESTQDLTADAETADEPIVGADNDITIDIGDANTGILPEAVWGVLDLILGQLLFANDMLSVGLTEDLLANIIDNFLPDFDKDSLSFLPNIKVTSASDTSGINILFGGAPSIQIQLGVMSGMDSVIAVNDIVANPDRYIAKDLYGIANVEEYLKDIKVSGNAETGYKLDAENGDKVIVSTSEYALAAYASSETIWLGDRHNLTIENGKPVFNKEENAYGDARIWDVDENGLYGDIPQDLKDYQGISEAEFVTYSAGGKMLVAAIELLMRRTDKTYTYGANGEKRYTLHPEYIKGKYIKLGDLNVAIEIGDLGIRINEEFTGNMQATAGLNPEDFKSVTEAKLRLSTNIDVSFFGEAGEAVDLSELLDLILKKIPSGSPLANNELVINIVGALGDKDNPYLNAKLDAYIDLATFSLEVALVVNRYQTEGEKAGELGNTLLAVYLKDDSVYIDLSGILGDGVMVSITNLGLNQLLADKLGGLLASAGIGGSSATEAVTATIEDALGMTLHDYAYLGVLINPGYFSLQLTAMVINAIVAKIGEENPDLKLDFVLPDFGDIMIAAHGDKADGAKLSINAKFAEGFMGAIDINTLTLGTEPVFGTEAGRINLDTSKFSEVYNATTGNIAENFYLSANAFVEVSMTSEGLKPGDANYDNSLAGWGIRTITNLLLGALDETMLGLFSQGLQSYYTKLSTADAQAWKDKGGILYTTETPDDLGSYTEYKGEISDAVALYKFDPKVNVTFAENDVNLIIDIAADIDLGSIVAFGIGGILFSDLKLEIRLGEPFNSQFLTVYYLGSSRLEKEGNIYTLGTNGTVFSDAIYIDASGLGLGKIKFQGITGLLGANIGKAFDENAVSADAGTSADDAESSAGESQADNDSVSVAINIAEGSIGLELDAALINTIFGLLPELPIELPSIQKLAFNLAFSDNGISSISLEGILDEASTGLQLAISDIGISLDKQVDVESIVGEVSIGYSGITYSKTAGLMTLIQNVIDGIAPSLGITIEKNATFISLTAETSGARLRAAKYGNTGASSVTLIGNRRADAISGTNPAPFRLVLDLAVKHPDRGPGGANTPFTATIHFGNNNLLIQNLSVGNGTVDSLLKTILGETIDAASLAGTGSNLFNFAYTDADSNEWSYPGTSTRPDYPGAVTASDDYEGTAKTSALSLGSSYEPKLDGLIQSIDLNLFNSNGYQPYLSGTKAQNQLTDSSKYLSVKIEFGKDAFNELLIMVYTIVLGLIQEFTDSRNADSFFFPDPAKMTNYNYGYWYYSSSLVWEDPLRDYAVLPYSNNIKGLIEEVGKKATTQEKVELIKPYVQGLPVALLQWVLYGGLLPVSESLVGAAMTLAGDSVGNIGILIGSLLPIPFASYDANVPNPSANIYIDFAPNASDYGVSGNVSPGIQAIELMINVAKTEQGGKYVTNNINNANGANNLNSYAETMVLTINPRSLLGQDTSGSGILGFTEGDTAEIINNNNKIGENTRIDITDPATREGQITFNTGATQSITLNGKGLSEVLPLTANVTFANGMNSEGGSGNDYTGGTTIVWDASSVDLTAAAVEDEDGKRLAGYVYGYALNVVVAAIPVYITNDFGLSNIYGYTTSDGKTYTQSKIEVDMSSESKVELPDLVRIRFLTGGTRTFGTQLTDEQGNKLLAVLKLSDGKYETITEKDAEGNLLTNVHGGTYVLYPAFVAGLTGETFTDTATGMTYQVLDVNKLPSGRNFPVGVITWDTETFKYGWDGAYDVDGNSGNDTLNVGFTYQWGYSAETYGSYPVTVKRNAISSVSRFSEVGEDGAQISTIKNFNTFKGNTVGSLLNGKTFVEYLQTFNKMSGRYTSNKSFTNIDVVWDDAAIKAVTDAIAAITTADGTVEYWRGIDVTVTLYVGEYWAFRGGVDKTSGNASYGMVDAVGFVNPEQTTGKVQVRQPYQVNIKIEESEPPTTIMPAPPATEEPVALNFTDGSRAYAGEAGYLEYTIGTSAQLYGLMPTSGTVVNPVTGEEKTASFDWNGFRYDAEAVADVALVTVNANGTQSEVPVVVTLADNQDVSDGVNNLLGENSTSEVVKIVDAKYRAMVIDPFLYKSFAAYTSALPAELKVKMSDGSEKTLKVNWGSVEWGNDSALPAEGYRNDKHAITFSDESGTQYAFTLPLLVMERTIVSSDLAPEGYVLLSETRRFSSIIRTYTNAKEQDGQLLEISYSRETGMPTAIAYYNAFAFNAENDIPKSVKLVFAGSGEEVVYTLRFKAGVEGNDKAFALPADFTSTTSSASPAVMEIVSGDVVIGEISLDVSFKSVRINRYNSTIAADDLVTLRYSFDVYGANTPFAYGEYNNDFVYYIDGKFVAKDVYEAEYKSNPAYKALGKTAEDVFTPYYYLYDNTSKTYSLAKAEDTNCMVFVYTASDTIAIDSWNHASLSYTYTGGVRNTSANVKLDNGTETGAVAAVNVPLNIKNAALTGEAVKFGKTDFDTSAENKFVKVDDEQNRIIFCDKDGNDFGGVNYFDIEKQTFNFDPFSGIVLNAKHFPTTGTAVTVSGEYAGLAVTVDYANIGMTYQGGWYRVTITVSAIDIKRGVNADGTDNLLNIKKQTARKDMAFVVSHNATLAATGNETLVGMEGMSAATAIDPYEFSMSDFRDSLPTSIKVAFDNGTERSYAVGASDGYVLNWKTSSMKVNYMGGKTYLTAQLTGPDGSTQELLIPMFVKRVIVTDITGTKGSNEGLVITFDENGVSKDITKKGEGTPSNVFEINPYDVTTHNLPKGYNVNFKVYMPKEDGSFGEPEQEPKNVTYNYIAVAMPSTLDLTVDLAKKGGEGRATMQIDGGQRLSVKLAVKAVDISTQSAPSLSATGNVLPTKVSVGGVTVSVVWYGTAKVSYNAGQSTAEYKVTFASPGSNYTIPAIANRKVTYTLTAYIGAIVDSAGRVLDTVGGEPVSQLKGNTITVTV